MTSLAFMWVLVPLPVWKTSTGKWASSVPLVTSSAAAMMASALAASSRPARRCASAAARLTSASAAMKSLGIVQPEIGKFATARAVCGP